jgi:hypothetical protein
MQARGAEVLSGRYQPHHQRIGDSDGSPDSKQPAARRTHDDAVRCRLAIELSKKSWIVAVNTPLSDKISHLYGAVGVKKNRHALSHRTEPLLSRH